MPRVVLMHDVEDVDRWLEGKAERAAAIGQIGIERDRLRGARGSP